MRLLASTLLTSALALPASAQISEFTDPDFGFRMQLPAGMSEVPAADRAKLLDLELDQVANLARGEVGDQPLRHNFIWLDAATPYNRQITVLLQDGPPPFRSPAEARTALGGGGMTIDKEAVLPPPVDGLRVDGSFTRPDGVKLRKVSAYLPDFVANRWALVSIQAFDGDFAIVAPEVEAFVSSLRFQRQRPEAPAAVARGPIRPGGKNAAPPPAADWGSLRVGGSLALAALLLGHLLLGGRSSG